MIFSVKRIPAWDEKRVVKKFAIVPVRMSDQDKVVWLQAYYLVETYGVCWHPVFATLDEVAAAKEVRRYGV